MIKLGLIGKNIKHSKSQQMYEDILKQTIQYRLIDVHTESELPDLKELFEDLDGISVTSPYKRSYIGAESTELRFDLFPAINCIRKVEKSESFELYNTDYLAVRGIVQKLLNEFPAGLDVIILGNGNMANITSIVFDEFNVHHQIFSRSKNKTDLNTLDYDKLFELKGAQRVLVNCCSREFIFKAFLPEQTLFWDHNYSMDEHVESLSQRCDYRDGVELLWLQAYEALKIWGLHS